jgi:hypothetical protein
MGNISENGPNGSTLVAKTGSQSYTDPYTGINSDIPTFTRTTTLSPEQQAIANQQNSAKLNLATLGSNLSGTLGNQLTSNFKMGNDSTEARLFELGRKRLDPMFAQQQDALDTKLANQGFARGSAGFDNAQRAQSNSQNDAHNQLLLTGRGQADQEQLTEDNQRINQIGALMNGGQVSQPSFMGANMPTIPTTDTAGIINNNYQQTLAAANAKNSQTNGVLGGLFSLGSSFLYSDERLKQDIKRIGTADNKAGGAPHIGFLAHEVEALHPEAVKEFNGFKAVNYEQAVL